MRPLLVFAMILGGLSTYNASAQRGGGGGIGHGGAGRGGMSGRGGFGGGFSGGFKGRNGNSRQQGWNHWNWNRNNGWGYAGFGDYGFGYGWPSYDDGDAFDNAPTGFMMPFQPPPALQPPPPPSEPAIPVMHEYAWPASATNSTAPFSIVSKDGTVREALAVWVQGNQVRYTMAGGRSSGVAQTAIDCSATDRLNSLNKQRLALPGCSIAR